MVPNRVTSFSPQAKISRYSCFYLGSPIQEFCKQTAEKSNEMETSRTHYGLSTLCQKCVFSEFQLFVLATFNLTFSTYLTFLRALFNHALRVRSYNHFYMINNQGYPEISTIKFPCTKKKTIAISRIRTRASRFQIRNADHSAMNFQLQTSVFSDFLMGLVFRKLVFSDFNYKYLYFRNLFHQLVLTKISQFPSSRAIFET